MKLKALKPCPLCGRYAEAVSPVKGVWNISCGDGMNDSCNLVLFGGSDDSLHDMVQRWNTRATESEEE